MEQGLHDSSADSSISADQEAKKAFKEREKALALRNGVQIALIDAATEGLDDHARMTWQIENMYKVAEAFDEWFKDKEHYRWVQRHAEEKNATTAQELAKILTREELRKILDELGHPGASSSHAGTA
ncbi:hypothetical protein KBA73_01520 [Patescibacteria group bacterium]|nr:hypothetical protein [Patescibacteria group bacterium]